MPFIPNHPQIHLQPSLAACTPQDFCDSSVAGQCATSNGIGDKLACNSVTATGYALDGDMVADKQV